MDQAQQRVGSCITVGGGDVLREAEHHLVLLIEPMPDLEPDLGVALAGVVDRSIVDAQCATRGLDQAQGTVGDGREIVGGEGLQAVQRVLLELAAQVVVILAVQLGFEIGFQYPLLTDATGVVLDQGCAPAIGAGGHIRLRAVVFAQRQRDQG